MKMPDCRFSIFFFHYMHDSYLSQKNSKYLYLLLFFLTFFLCYFLRLNISYGENGKYSI